MYSAGDDMLKFTLKQLFISILLISIGMGLLGILFRPWAFSPPQWIGRPMWFFGELFIGTGVLSLFTMPVFLGGSTGLVIVLIAASIPDCGEGVRIGTSFTAMLLAIGVFLITARKDLRLKSLTYRLQETEQQNPSE
jgi:hypothetical protein